MPRNLGFNTRYKMPKETLNKIVKSHYHFHKMLSDVKNIPVQLKVLIILILLVGVALLFYYLIYKKPPVYNTKTLVSTPVNINMVPNINTKQMKIKSHTHRYSISFWTYLTRPDHEFEWNNILQLYNVNSKEQVPGFWLTQNGSLYVAYNISSSMQYIVIDNIGFNKWLNIVCVVDNRSISLYINGELYNTKILQQFPKLITNSTQMIIGNNISSDNIIVDGKDGTIDTLGKLGDGSYIAFVQVYSKLLNPESVQDIYLGFLPQITDWQNDILDKNKPDDIMPLNSNSTSDEDNSYEYDYNDNIDI